MKYDVAGEVTTLGGRGNTAPADADCAVVQRLRAAGAVIVGRTNMSEFGQFPATQSALHGACLNPWDPSRSPGGSSGGSAVAVAFVREYANARGAEVIKLCAKIEEELIGLSDEETHEMLQSLGAQQSGLELIIKRSFAKLSLISYFTAGEMEVRAWTITKGWKAPKAASVIHNDFERGFIRAEVIGFDDFIACGGEGRAKEAGKMRLEGKDYVVQDGDVMHFRFNV